MQSSSWRGLKIDRLLASISGWPQRSDRQGNVGAAIRKSIQNPALAWFLGLVREVKAGDDRSAVVRAGAACERALRDLL